MTSHQASNTFSSVFPEASPPSSCRVPGRINLLGEHLDYNGLPVLPMCIDRFLDIQYAPASDGMIHLANADADFPPVRFMHSRPLPPGAPGAWENYVKAALQAINTAYSIKHPLGMYLWVESNLPKAMGLSSSSALVIGTALAYLDLLGKAPRDTKARLALAELLARGEHYVGTQGGGMDQAILLLGEQDHALKIDFHPLRTTPAPLFDDYLFVVADSLERAEKSKAQRNTYNAGPLLCRLCRHLLEKALERQSQQAVHLERLATLWFGERPLTQEAITRLIQQEFPEDGLSLAEAAGKLEMTVPELRERIVPGLMVEDDQKLPLLQRMQHQVSEFQRVEAGYDALRQGNAQKMGRLMTASHASCRDHYAISTASLDALVDSAIKAGALGARLTGAGLGGAVISLIPRELFSDFRVKLINTYYTKRLGKLRLYPVFPVRASSGASLMSALHKMQ